MRYTDQINNLKNDNINVVLSCFRKYPYLTINKISQLTNLSIPSTSKYINMLLKHNMILKKVETKSTAGRKAAEYFLNSDYCSYLLVYLGNENIVFDVLDYSFKSLSSNHVQIKFANFKEFVLCNIADYMKHFPNIKYIAMATYCTTSNGVITDWINNQQLEGLDLKLLIENRFNVPCIIEMNMKVISLGISRYLNPCDRNVTICQNSFDGLGFTSIIDKKLHYGINDSCGNVLPEVFDIETKEGFKAIVELCANVVMPDKMIVYSSPEDKEKTMGLIEDIKSCLRKNSTTELVYSEDFYKDIRTGLKTLINRSTKIRF